MQNEPVFAGRLLRMALTDQNGAVLGRVEDLVLAPAYGESPPRVLGFVANVQRRRIFVNVGRVGNISSLGVSLHTGTVDLRRFELRAGELLVSRLLGRPVGGEILMDIALERDRTGWSVKGVALGRGRGIYRRTRRVVDWQQASALFEAGPLAAEVATFRDMNPTDVASRVRSLPPGRQVAIANAFDEEHLADLLEELPEEEQVRLLQGMGIDRVAEVVEEMEPDDAVDLLGAMPDEERERLLAALEPREAASLRRLLRYDVSTAGGLMTSEPVVVSPEVQVAEVLARLRDPDVPAAVAAQAFVCEPPTTTPTGPYLGTAGFQRLMREAPSTAVAHCLDNTTFVHPDLPEVQVAERLAAYNLIAVAVCDDQGNLLGAVSVDDVLDRVLPSGWRWRR
ncbi:MAG TPA: CBS domain-containing protein [Acidimicrobiales bacterium]|nr:CBS domain-containing protein [Acidimicrobiales bacterium]